MKKSFFIFLLFISASVFSQSPVIKISETKLKEAKSVKDIIPGLDACNIKSFVVSIAVVGQAKEYENQKEFFDATAKAFMMATKKGKAFFIENIKSDCMPKRSIKFIVE